MIISRHRTGLPDSLSKLNKRAAILGLALGSILFGSAGAEVAVGAAAYVVWYSNANPSGTQIAETWGNPIHESVRLEDSNGDPYYDDESTGPVYVRFQSGYDHSGRWWLVGTAGQFSVYGANVVRDDLLLYSAGGTCLGVSGLYYNCKIGMDISGDITGNVTAAGLSAKSKYGLVTALYLRCR